MMAGVLDMAVNSPGFGTFRLMKAVACPERCVRVCGIVLHVILARK